MAPERTPSVLHLVITRFNLRMAGIDKDWSGRGVLGDDWLRERIALFERYCLPSVANQRNLDFSWLLLLDEGSPDDLVAQFERHADALPLLEPMLLPEITDHTVIADAIRSRVDPDVDLLITTRVDNDDAIHERFTEEVRNNARPTREFLNFRWGWVHDGERARLHSQRYGHFMSLTEPRSAEPFATVHNGLPHGRAHRLAPVRQLRSPPFWLDTQHGRNVYARMPEGRHRHDFTTARGIARFVRDGISRPLHARLSWPKLAGKAHPLADVAGPFHLAE